MSCMATHPRILSRRIDADTCIGFALAALVPALIVLGLLQ